MPDRGPFIFATEIDSTPVPSSFPPPNACSFIYHRLIVFFCPFFFSCFVFLCFLLLQVGGVVETNRPDTKNAQYQACIKQGDVLLNRVQKLGRVVDA